VVRPDASGDGLTGFHPLGCCSTPEGAHAANAGGPWKCRATTVGVLFAGRQRGGKTTASKEAASRSSEGLHNPAAVASGGAHDAEAQGRDRVRPPCREAGVVLRRGPADDAALHASSTTAEDREPPGDEARDGLDGGRPSGSGLCRLWAAAAPVGRRATLLAAPVRCGASRPQRLLSASPYGRSCFDFVPERPRLGLLATSSTMPW
jgi:hypothetical protein